MSTDVILRPGAFEEVGLEIDPILPTLLLERKDHPRNFAGVSQEWDAPLDLRVARPHPTDLLKFWVSTNLPVPAPIKASLGPKIPILLTHVLTPFASDHKSPCQVWRLDYEFVAEGDDFDTIAVLPNDEVCKLAELDQKVSLGLQLGGEVGVPKAALEIINQVPGIKLTGAEIEASTDQKFQISIKLQMTLRKVTGAPVGTGGAKWQMYRQDERLDGPHSLLQTMVVPPKTKKIKCTIKTSAWQVGLLGGSLGAKLWRYPDQPFEISLAGLSTD